MDGLANKFPRYAPFWLHMPQFRYCVFMQLLLSKLFQPQKAPFFLISENHQKLVPKRCACRCPPGTPANNMRKVLFIWFSCSVNIWCRNVKKSMRGDQVFPMDTLLTRYWLAIPPGKVLGGADMQNNSFNAWLGLRHLFTQSQQLYWLTPWLLV